MHESITDTAHLATNAPEGWPAIPFAEDARALTKLHLLTALEAGLRAAPGFRVSAQEHLEFFDRGMLQVDAVVEGPGGRWPVFLYPRADVEAARHFLAVARYRPLGHRIGAPVYLAPSPLPPADRALPLSEVLRMDRLPVVMTYFGEYEPSHELNRFTGMVVPGPCSSPFVVSTPAHLGQSRRRPRGTAQRKLLVRAPGKF